MRFACQPDCGACCTNHGAYNYVYLERDDAERISEFLEISRARFERTYTTVDDGHPVLRMDEPDCPFLSGKRCTIYPVRPRQCRTFPFWEENLRSRAAWKRLADFCPGIDTGETVPRETIEEHVSQRADE